MYAYFCISGFISSFLSCTIWLAVFKYLFCGRESVNIHCERLTASLWLSALVPSVLPFQFGELQQQRLIQKPVVSLPCKPSTISEGDILGRQWWHQLLLLPCTSVVPAPLWTPSMLIGQVHEEQLWFSLLRWVKLSPWYLFDESLPSYIVGDLAAKSVHGIICRALWVSEL